MGTSGTRPAGFVSMAVALLLFAATHGAAQTNNLLEPGFKTERPLKAGEVHPYEVNLTAGQYFEVHIEQQDVDVQPKILDPDGTVVYGYDYGEWGDEPAALIAAKTGRYRLEIHTEPSSPPAGRYRLRVEAIRAPTAADIARAEVVRAQNDAFPLIHSNKADYGKGRTQYERILAMWESLGDGFGVAHALTALRVASDQQDDRLAAREYSAREIAAYRALGNDYGEARALRGGAIILTALGNGEEAHSALERSLALHRAAGRTSSMILLFADLANNRGRAGDFEAALRYAYDSIALARDTRNPLLEARGWNAAGLIHQSLGELEVAIDAYKRVRTLSPGNDALQVDAVSRMGTTFLSLGDLEQAQPLLEEGLARWNRLGLRGQQSQMLVGLGDVQLRLGALDKAREYFEQAVTRAEEASYALGQAIARRKLAETLLKLGRPGEAESVIDATPLDLIANPNVRALSVALQARVALAEGDRQRARRLATDAVALTESVHGLAQATRIEAGVLASAQPVYEAATDVLMASHEADPGAGFAEQAFAMSERARARSLLESVAGGAGIVQGTGETWTELRQVRRALNAKAVALGNARPGGTTRIAVTRDIDELSTRAAVLEGQLRREQPALGAIATAEPISVARLQQEMLDDRTVLVEYMLGRTRSYAWVISRAHFASYVLAPRAQIEEAAVRAREIASLPSQRSAAASLASGAALGRLLLPPFGAIAPGHRVLVVAPGVLQDVPFAALPLDESGRRPLIAAHELVYAPSAAVLLAVRTAHEARTAPRRGIAVFADPVFEPTDPRVAQRATAPPPTAAAAAPAALDRVQRGSEGAELVRLPFTGLEAERIASVLPAGDVMKATGFAANAAALKGGAANAFRIVHFATHGVLNTRTPELSGLVLSLVDEQGRPQDGFLRLHEVENLHLNADLVVLSGCETARGRRVDGEGTIGLTRGFLEAGARAVVASLWRVDDLATAELMQAFYTNLLRRKLPAPAALRAAQRELAASPRWAQPYYWAGFVVQGDWR